MAGKNGKECMKHSVFTDDIYRRWIDFSFGTHDEWQEYITKKYKHGQVPNARGYRLNLCDDTSCGVICVWVNSALDDWEAALHHELIHAAHSVFDMLGLEVETQDMEHFCYYSEWMYRTCLKTIKNRKGK